MTPTGLNRYDSNVFSSHSNPTVSSLSLEALAPLAGPLPLDVLAELSLWFTHSVPSGLTGWRKDTEQSGERSAGGTELRAHTAIYNLNKVTENKVWVS